MKQHKMPGAASQQERRDVHIALTPREAALPQALLGKA